MTKQLHTKGPWAVDSRNGFSVVSIHDQGICSTGGYSDNQRDAEELNNEQRANANLIAAAPELLNALTKLYAVMSRRAVEETPMHVLEKVENAIAKAEGRL